MAANTASDIYTYHKIDKGFYEFVLSNGRWAQVRFDYSSGEWVANTVSGPEPTFTPTTGMSRLIASGRLDQAVDA